MSKDKLLRDDNYFSIIRLLRVLPPKMILADENRVPSTEYSSTEIRTVTKIKRKQQNDINSYNKNMINKRKRDFVKKLNYLNIAIVFVLPLVAILASDLGFSVVSLNYNTFVFSVLYYGISCICINAGYHRLFAHRTYDAILPLKLVFAVLGPGAGIGSIKWWSSNHRAHHRFTDTEKDPHSINRGFFFAHIGWFCTRPHAKLSSVLKDNSDNEDLQDDLILWQDENYCSLFILGVFLLPGFVCMFWDDFKGGVVYAGIIRMIFVQHTIFNINSVCHSFGSQFYDDRKSPRDFFLWNFITFGEGNHNFHHEFPSDYRTGNNWYDLDPSKWFIFSLSLFGITFGLQKADQGSIQKLILQQRQKILDKKRAQLNWGVPIDRLPVISPQEFQRLAKSSSRALVAVSGIVHDVTPFLYDHPGGVALVKASIGKDATSVFNGAVYDHSNAAHNLLATMRVAVLSGNTEEMVWKQQQIENKEVPIKNDSVGKRIVRSGEQVTMNKALSKTAGAA